MEIRGIWLPVVTPFHNGEVDFVSYKKLIDHYIGKGIEGIIPLGTTGESPSVFDYEVESIIVKTIEFTNGRVPVFAGVGGNHTDKVIKQINVARKLGVQGILSVSPYYNRPDQNGIYQHFKKISETTDLPIIMYNIPYRTGRNMENDTIRKLAELPGIAGIKDSCGDIRQSMDLLLDPPENFSILTGEDMLYYLTLTLGGHGGILASAHLHTERFVSIYNSMNDNDHRKALEEWKTVADVIPLLFAEPNPAPIKYYLHKSGLINSAETRLPITDISAGLAKRLDAFL